MIEYKIKKLFIDDENTIQYLSDIGLITVPTDKEIVVHDKKIMDIVKALETKNKRCQELENTISVLKKQQSTTEIKIDYENEKLRKELDDKNKCVSEYQNQITNLGKQLVALKDDYKKQMELNQSLQDTRKDDTKIENQLKELQDKINNLVIEKKELISVNDGLKQKHDEINKNMDMFKVQVTQANFEKDKIKQDLNKFLKLPGYNQLIKEAILLKSFIDDPVKRQFQFEEEFKDVMSPPSIRRYLYHLTELGLLSKPFHGQYELNVEDFKLYSNDVLMEKIVSKVMNADLQYFINSILDSNKSLTNHIK